MNKKEDKRRQLDKITPESRENFIHKDWTSFRKFLHSLGEPTPIFDDKDEEDDFYHKLEEEYKQRGEWH